MPASRSFVIIYAGHEGSSALIDTLGRHPAIYAAGVEHLDLPNLQQHAPDPQGHLGELLDRALTTGEVPGLPTRYSGEAVIGFKWRPFGASAAAETFRRHQTRVVFLFRRNALARALSATLKPDHTQFRITNMPPGEREGALDQLRAERFVADPPGVAENIERYCKARADHWSNFGRAGLEVQPLEYEWFSSDPLAAVNALLSLLAVEPFEESPPTKYVRTYPDIEGQCDNLAEVRRNESVRRALLRHAALLDEIEGIARQRWSRWLHRRR